MRARSDLLAQVARRLGDRQLVWFGTRGDDIESITDIPNLEASVTITAPYRARAKVRGVAIEELSGRRVDLDVYEVDDELDDPAVQQARDILLRILSRPSALVTYRSSAWVSAVAFARASQCTHLVMFKDHQVAFEHKPWVESALRVEGIEGIEWRYAANEDQLEMMRRLADGPLMLRPSRSCGGVGLSRVRTQPELESEWPGGDEALVSVARFLHPTVPVNIGGVVWDDGVTLHPASVQLIGVPELTSRQFGYCGNDFGAFGALDDDVIDQVDAATRSVGRWLQRHGYRGAFGVDYLVHQGRAIFTEVNPRFQGSTHLSARISLMRGEPCIMLEHIAALMRLPAPQDRPLRSLAREIPPLAHMVVHCGGVAPRRLDLARPLERLAGFETFLRADLVPPPELELDPGAAACRISVRDRVTEDGFALTGAWRQRLQEVSGLASGQPAPQPSLR